MELARIVAMAMIVFGHFIFHGIQGTIGPSPNVTPYLDWRECVILSMSVLCCAGVDIFMLISGYFGIKLRWKSVLSFYFLCLFYNVLSLAVSAFSQPVSLTDILNVFFILWVIQKGASLLAVCKGSAFRIRGRCAFGRSGGPFKELLLGFGPGCKGGTIAPKMQGSETSCRGFEGQRHRQV